MIRPPLASGPEPRTGYADLSFLTDAVASLTSAATGPCDVSSLLSQLSRVAAAHLPVDGAGVMLADGSSLTYVRADAADPTFRQPVERSERLQERLQQGPCADAFTHNHEVVITDLRTYRNGTWGEYLESARSAEIRSVVAIPLIGRGRTWGVLDLYRRWAGGWGEKDLAAARLLAAMAVAFLVMAVDADARQAQSQLTHLTLHDSLTGLPNRDLLFDRLNHALARARRRHRTVAALFIDLDHFKYINDTHGHAAGDAVLLEVTRRMASTLRKGDTLARLSGDEFVLVCEDLPQQNSLELDGQIGAVTHRLHRALAGPIVHAGVAMTVAASIGAAVSAVDTTADDLLADADTSMYRAKQRRTIANTVRLPGDEGPGPGRHLGRDLGQALLDGQLQVHFQPIVSTCTDAIRAVEALLRWQHPVHGLLPARDFIDLAERDGSILPIGHWAIDNVCAQIAKWCDGSRDGAPESVYVNLNGQQLGDPQCLSVIAAAVRRHGIRPRQLGFEIVGATFIDPYLADRLRHLHQLGHPLAVDDFGTGYSSLARLVDTPASIAKIDKSLVRDIGRDDRRSAIVEAIVVIAERLGLEVVAEGIETTQQAQLLNAVGCHLQQGFLHGRPVGADELSERWARSSPEPGVAVSEGRRTERSVRVARR